MALKLARTRYSETMCNAVFRLLSDVFTSFLMAVSGTQSLFCLTRVCLEAPKLDLLRSTCCSRDSMNTAYFDLHTSSKKHCSSRWLRCVCSFSFKLHYRASNGSRFANKILHAFPWSICDHWAIIMSICDFWAIIMYILRAIFIACRISLKLTIQVGSPRPLAH